jgi:Zn-dependent metalloprotease
MRIKLILSLLVCGAAAAILSTGSLAQEKSICSTKVRANGPETRSVSSGEYPALVEKRLEASSPKGLTAKAASLSNEARFRSAVEALRRGEGKDIRVSRTGARQGWVTLKGPLGEKTADEPDDVARKFLKQHHALFALESDLSDVRLSKSLKSLGGHHVFFNQLYRGIPVEGGEVKAHLLKDGRIHAVESRIAADLSPDTVPRVSHEEAIDISRGHLNVTGRLRGGIAAELVILPEPSPGILAWKVSVPAWQPCGDWVVMVDAQEGTVLSVTDIREFATGAAKVFDPNPVVSLRTTSLSDQGDSASAIPQNAYTEVVLEDLDDTGYLRGPYVDTGLTASRAFSPTLDFRYDRSQDGFEEVMVYYHIQEFRKYLRDGLAFPLEVRQVLADAHASDNDNSWYSPLISGIFFGDGGVDDGEDAYLVIHEYFHAVIYEIVGEPTYSAERDAMNEGTADYFAASFFASHDFMPETFAQWDGIASVPIGVRRVDSNKVYPRDFTGESHDDGEIWSSALWHMRGALGREVADKLILEGMYYLDSSSQFSEGLEAILLADEAVYGGVHADAIADAFADRGILSPSLLKIGNVRNGALASGDLTMPDGSYFDQYTFEGVEGQLVKITMTSPDFDAYLILQDPYFDSVVHGDDLADGSTNAQVALKIPYAGTYRILANTYSQGDTGQYTLSLAAGSLTEGTPQSTSLRYGVEVSGRLTDGDLALLDETRYDEYAFAGHIGQQVTISMSSATLDCYLVLYDEFEDILAEDDDSGPGTDALITYTLPEDATYLIAANQAALSSGDYALLLTSSDPLIPLGEIVSGALASGDLQFPSDDSYFDPYQFQGNAGQTLSMKMYSDDFDVYMLVYNPYYQVIAELDDTASLNTNAVIEEIQLNVPGTYFVIANSYGGNETGDYKLAVASTNVTDIDGDGFSDHIEIAEGANPLDSASAPPDADGDFLSDSMDPDDDNDGMLDIHELLAGTDPLDPASLLRVLDISVSGEGFVIRWSSIPSRSYAVHRSPDLANWSVVQSDVASQGAETSWTDTDPRAGSAAFYRVEPLPADD